MVRVEKTIWAAHTKRSCWTRGSGRMSSPSVAAMTRRRSCGSMPNGPARQTPAQPPSSARCRKACWVRN